jgi:hypothetical protein
MVVTTAGLVIAGWVTGWTEARLDEVVLSATTQRIVQQLEGPLVEAVPQAELSGPYTAAKLDQAASDLRPLLARARATRTVPSRPWTEREREQRREL